MVRDGNNNDNNNKIAYHIINNKSETLYITNIKKSERKKNVTNVCMLFHLSEQRINQLNTKVHDSKLPMDFINFS